MAEKLEKSRAILALLRAHEIGYHSSSHSVRPAIFEFTDTENYEEAYHISRIRETSHINPLTGQIEGTGGINAVRNLFPEKKILAYRAPGPCWSPPHLEALRDLGIKFDFSADISSEPIYHKGITFYPYPVLPQWHGSLQEYNVLLFSMLRNKITVLCSHPNLFVNEQMWDSMYWYGNPTNLMNPPLRRYEEIRQLFFRFELLLRTIKFLEEMRLVTVASRPTKAKQRLVVKMDDVQKCYERSIQWPTRFFKYQPRFLMNHFNRFFNVRED